MMEDILQDSMKVPRRKLRAETVMLKNIGGRLNRARNWQRYDHGGESTNLKFEEGVDSYVPYAGKLRDNLEITLSKIKATMSSCGAASISELQKTARLTVVSSTSIIEGGLTTLY